MTRWCNFCLPAVVLLLVAARSQADVGDPQLGTDHPWYSGELSCSTFPRLFAAQAAIHERVTGVRPRTDQDKALAAWLWRNTHYFHGEEGNQDLWGQGFQHGADMKMREYWTGLFAHGFSLCGTDHAQWVAEMEALLGHSRGRVTGVEGHNSFEVLLTGGPYGSGKWVLLDHDVSTVIFNRTGKELLSIAEVQPDCQRLTSRDFAPEKQHGWLVCGLHPGDGAAYRQYRAVEYLAGYSAVPPLVHLRRGESLRRYFKPGLEDGKTFVFWGRNYRTAGIPGPERGQTWVNQPELMHGSRTGTPYRPGQVRFANAVYTYRPNFQTTDYKEAVTEEDDHHVVFELVTPYIIGATPPNDQPWGIYDSGCRNGLVLHGKASCSVAISTDDGHRWQECGPFRNGMDLTDHVKGHQHYLLRLQTGARELASSELSMRTVCQASPAVLPRLKEGGSEVRFLCSAQAVVSAGPTLAQAQTHLVAGKFGTPNVTLELGTPRGERPLAIYAAGHVFSGNPPRPEIRYQIEASTDGGETWKPVVKDWSIPRRGQEPGDFWSQSFCWGQASLEPGKSSHVRVRFHNDGGRAYPRCEAHLVYRAAGSDATQVTYTWTEEGQPRTTTHRFESQPVDQKTPATWQIPTGRHVETQWVEEACLSGN